MSAEYWDQTVLLLHCEGADGSTDFKDATYRNLLTPINGAQISTAHSPYGAGSSGAFTGGTCRLETPNPGVVADMTQEMMLRFSAFGVLLRYSDGGDAANLGAVNGYVHMYQANTSFPVSTLPVDAWFHLRAVRQNGVGYLFVAGKLVWSGAVGTAVSTSGTLQIGGTHDVGGVVGHIANLRIQKGVALSTADFIPPAGLFEVGPIFRAADSPLYWDQTVLLMGMEGENDSTYFCDERHNLVAAVGGVKISTAQSPPGAGSSAYFDGHGAYLIIPSSEKFDFSSVDFAIEFRIKPLLMPTAWMRLMQFGANADTKSLQVYVDASGGLLVSQCTPSPSALLAEAVITAGEWQNIAIVVVGTTGWIFKNGVPLHLVTSVLLRPSPGGVPLYIGTNPDTTGQYSSSDFTGYMGGVKITRAVAPFTSPYIPLPGPFPVQEQTDPHWSNVVLALPMDDVALADLRGHAVTKHGSVARSTAAAKFNGASAYFDGATGSLRVPLSSDFAFGTGDLTIDGWFNPASTAEYNILLDMRVGDVNGVLMYLNGGKMCFQAGGDVRSTGSVNVSTNAWHYAELARRAGVTRLFLDGAAIGSPWVDATNYSATSVQVGEASGEYFFHGHMQYWRITKSIGRHTNPFALPVEPFGTVSIQSLSGTVADENGNFISRTARSYSRATGQLIGTAVSDPVTGLFELPAESTDEHFVVVFDDTKNAMIYDHVVPVI